VLFDDAIKDKNHAISAAAAFKKVSEAEFARGLRYIT
jgi:hypothetical protein